MTEPVILMVAPNGARLERPDHPGVPLTADALARDARDCVDAGAALFHMHVRTADGAHSLDAGDNRAAIAAVRGAVGDRIIVQMTTESVGRYTPAQQRAAVDAVEPEAVSLAVRELLATEADAEIAAGWLRRLASAGTLVQFIVYDAADLARLDSLVAAGIVPWPSPALLWVVGRSGDPERALRAFAGFVADAAARCWAVCGFGALEHRAALIAIASGGHVRVGFENNLTTVHGQRAASNAAQVAWARAAAELAGRPVADAALARAHWPR